MKEYMLSRAQFNETNDCVVSAFSHAMEMDYSEAHEFCKKGGRKDRKGCYTPDVYGCGPRKKARTIKGRLITYHSRKPLTVKSFLKKNPTGRFICVKVGHAFAIIDGICYNQLSDNSIIKYYYKVRL